MNTTSSPPSDLSFAEREFLIQLRSLLLKSVDLIERRVQIGKYKPARAVPYSPTETIASAVTIERARQEPSRLDRDN